jgi:8-oxo-dGTP pyrophosphatase MutT (NUDIX family)
MKAIAKRHKVVPAVYVLFRDDDKILLLRRANTGYCDGYYSMPSGHVGGLNEKGGESALQAAVRETKEEVGVDIDPNDLRLVHTLHRYSDEPGPHERMDLYFETEKWKGEPHNAEPQKCDEIRWASISDLPEKITPEARQALAMIAKSEPYSDMNF